MNTACFVLAICFWVLAALALVLFAAWVYVEVQYYHWNKTDREAEHLAEDLTRQVVENSANMLEHLERQIEEKFEELQK